MAEFGVRSLATALGNAQQPKDWPHSPAHRLGVQGAYMITAGTYQKLRFLNSPDRLDFALKRLFECALEFAWILQAWAVLSNHNHFVALSPINPENLRVMLCKLHGSI